MGNQHGSPGGDQDPVLPRRNWAPRKRQTLNELSRRRLSIPCEQSGLVSGAHTGQKRSSNPVVLHKTLRFRARLDGRRMTVRPN